ncbi:MAG: tRNA (adenosine(37)-N6)-threonylcarbamoyltransferase complex ATPase subunit type 1 TsaE [Erysipelotrichales bacterium]|nr:tRNA (adenosine(37)-N6)-threonylcarbamoyltransferase complex ATPase subunit type 1 TsaE [Erysipelotrichales bacterium]
MEIRSNSQEETIALAEKIAANVKEGMVITLKGDLGAGKTTFTKGIGKGLGIKKAISSPTFTIMKIYQGNMPLYHIDAYRLEEHFQDLGFEEYINGDGLCVVEWADFIEEILPKERLAISIDYEGDSARKITLTPIGEAYEALVKEL